MSTKFTNLVTVHYVLLTRSFIVILGCIAVWWGVVGFSAFWRESSAERVARQIIAGDPFKIDILSHQLAIIDAIDRPAHCDPAALRSAAIIRLRMMEAATSASASCREQIDEHVRSVRNVIRSSLSCSPADPFLWLALFWLESTQNGDSTEYLKCLWMSYRLGPNEGWIGIKRSSLALAVYDKLPAYIARSAASEFVSLLESGFYEQVASIFISLSPQTREILLPHLKNVAERPRQAFTDALKAKGEERVVPGIWRQEPRPWGRE